jgi:plastocyanin
MRAILLAGSAALVAVVGSTGLFLDKEPAAEAQTTANVAIGDNWFCDSGSANGTCDTNITAGDTVLWTNDGANPHTVTECGDASCTVPQSGGFDSGTLNNGQTFQRTFPTAGTFEYYCFIHGSSVMQGRVVVAAVQQTPSPTASASPAPGSPTTSPAGTGAATPTPSRAPAAAPATGGPADGGANWFWLVVALGGATIVASAASGVAALRRR